jgi:hypothetical protein
MKKCAVVLMSILMLAGVVWADMTDEQMQVRAQKAVQTFRAPSSVEAQTPVVPDRTNKPHRPKLIRERNEWKEQTAFRKINGDRLLMSKVAVDFSIQINGADTAYYEVGDEVTVTVEADRPLALMIYVDDGDSLFSFTDLNAFSHMEMGGEEFIIMVEDGDEMDMSPPDDGKWEITVPTHFEGDGPLWSLQNSIVYLVAMDMETELMDLAVAYVDEPIGASSYITGTVFEDDTTTVSNILVVAFPGSMEPVKSKEEPMAILLAKTDHNGNYSLAVTREMESNFPGPWTVFALDIWNLYGGYFTDPFYQEVDIPGMPVVDFSLVEATHTISGMVTSPEGLPVSGVTLYAYNGFFEISATTDETGYYEFLVMPGWYEIEFSESDLAGQYLIPYWGGSFVEVTETNEVLNIELYPVYPDEAITGTVSFPTKTNLTDLLVIADKWPIGYSIAPVDEFGNYAVPVTSELDCVYVEDEDWVSVGYFVWVARDGWEDPVTVPDSYSEVFSGTSGIDFTIIEPDAQLYGTVLDEQNGYPLYDAEIHVYTPDYEFDYRTWTDDNGFYHFNLPGDMTYILEAYYPGYWGEPVYTDEILLPANGDVQLDFSISPPEDNVTFAGTVYGNDGPLEGASVQLFSEEEMRWEMITDGSGGFFFENLPGYTFYNITVEAAGYNTWYDGIWLESSVYDYEIYLNPTDGNIWVQGQVTDGTNPIDGAIVWHYDEHGDHHIWTGEDGYFELWIPQGELNLKVGANGFMATKPVFFINQDTSIVVPLSPATLNENVSARVMDPNGGGIHDAFIYWESQDYIGHTNSNENGDYSIDLMAGEYYVHAEHWDYHDQNFVWSVPDPENDFNIVMFSQYEVYGPQILAVEDVPDDHGGKAILTWKINESLEWEGIEGFVVLFSEQDPESPEFKGWLNYPGNVIRALPEMDVYNAVVPVLHNDVTTFFRVVAVSDWEAWASNVVSGMAHDNLPPAVPTGLGVADVDGNPQISWAPVEMEPIKYYSVYRNMNGGDYELLDHTIDLTYTDEDMTPGTTYGYVVTATDYSENESDKSEQVNFQITSVEDNQIPKEFALRQNYPNPFNPVTTISFDLPEAVHVSLVIYDIVGNQVKEIYTGELEAGRYDYMWDGSNARGRSVSSGMYIYKLTAGKFSAYQKMILLR